MGRYNNVFLSETELNTLQTDLPTKWQHYIDRLSEYMASTAMKYAHRYVKRLEVDNAMRIESAENLCRELLSNIATESF